MGNVSFTIEEENLICIYHNWQEIIRPLCFPRCKAALSKAYWHFKP